MLSISKEACLALRKKVLEQDFDRMNEMQKEAVFATEGPLLVLAGAGSGKTTVLVNRITNIIRYGKAYHSEELNSVLCDADFDACNRFLEGNEELDDTLRNRLSVAPCRAWKVMAITFTNKAAGELKERLCAMLGDEGGQIWASTFHSSCARILRRHGERLGYSSHFTIYDSADSLSLMKSCLKRREIAEKSMPPKAVLNEISRAKDEMIAPKEFTKNTGEDFRLTEIAKLYSDYQQRMKQSDAMDFDDLIVNTVRLFKECPDVLEEFQNRFDYIMVDEYQDTNHAQYEFVNLLSKKKENLCVVGDDDQSIYKFRGATIENIMNFESDYSSARVIRLEQNYRSTQNILDAANAVINNNTARKGKTLWTNNGDGDKVIYHIAENEQDEADRVTQIILDGVAAGKKFSDFAVLYRMNAQSLAFERMFATQAVPHKIVGGTRFFDRQEIKDMVAYLSVINNPQDEIRLRRIINCPKRGIGDRTVETASQIGREIGESLFEVISHVGDFPSLTRAATKLRQFYEMMMGFIRLNLDESVLMSELYRSIIKETGYMEYLSADEAQKAETRKENVEELSSMIMRHEENDASTLQAFLEEVALVADIDNYDEKQDSVTMMTVHSAKGLEFPVVFLPGWEEGIFPGMSVIYNPDEVEEERRLSYVAITRAKEKLHIYSADTRMIFGHTARNKASRFLSEIPRDLMEQSRSREIVKTTTIPKFKGPETSGFAAEMNRKHQPATPMKPQGEAFQAGDTVQHKAFGTGLVRNATRMANDTLLEIQFDKVGVKKLFSNFARLKKSEE